MGGPGSGPQKGGGRGGSATNRMRAAIKKGRSRRTLAKLGGRTSQKKIYSMKYHKYVSAKKYYGS